MNYEVTKDNKFIKGNAINLRTKRSLIRQIETNNKEIYQKNIPKLLKESHFERKDLHSVYILYKCLQEITSQRHQDYETSQGVDYNTYKNGIYSMFMSSDRLAEIIFQNIDDQMTGFLAWDDFLKLMISIQAKTLKEKIDLFIKVNF